MLENSYNDELVECCYTKNQVKLAGRIIINPSSTVEEIECAIRIIDYWRLLHAQPLDTIMQSLNTMRGNGILSAKTTIAQRLKTRNSIGKKLKRQSNMQLSRMQDIAGCRIVVETVSDVYEVIKQLQNTDQFPHFFERQKDYIKFPKVDGYRCIHYVCRFDGNQSPLGKDLYVEIQIRTRLQHLWATAVETMSLYTQTDLKAGEGPEEILHFFQLASSLFALDEQQKTVPNTPTDFAEIYAELRELNQRHKISAKLTMLSVLTAELDTRNNNAGYYVLELDYATKSLKAKFFPKEALEIASKLYSELEIKNEGSNISVVLIASTSFSELKEAYPNYFADIGEFNNNIIRSNWIPAFMHHDNSVKIALRKTIANIIENNATKIDTFVTITQVDQNIKPDKPDGIGYTEGNIYYAMQNSPRLEDSYLRFSGIHFKESEETRFDKDNLPKFYGRAILLSSRGGSYYIDDTEWSVVADSRSYVLQLHDNNDPRMLIMLFLWLKSSVEYWHHLWSERKYLHKEHLPNKLINYALSNSFDKNLNLFSELISLEHKFIKEFHQHVEQVDYDTEVLNEMITKHNMHADTIASSLDKMVIDIIGFDENSNKLMKDDLSTIGIYQYLDAEH